MMGEILYIVIPCYNEEAVLPETAKRLKEKILKLINIGKISDKSRIVFVNDGSKDRTWEIIEELHSTDDLYSGIKLSRNRGHQNALLAGLMTVKEYADMVISMDADLQDDIDVIDKFIDEYYKGNDVVYGVRNSRATDTFFKKTTAEGFYKLMKVFGVDIVFNHADYRLMSKRSLNEMQNYKEVNLFLRGIVPLIGFNSSIVEYERHERFAGESKYPLKKMLAFAFDGITSFSTKLIRMVLWIGAIIFLLSIFVFVYGIIRKLTGNTVTGWTFIVCSIWMLGGVQLLCMGIIGEYIGKIYIETKARPRYVIDKFINK